VALARPNNDSRPFVIQGSNAQSDTLRLDFSGGVFTLPGGIQFNAGTGAGDDDGLELVGTGSTPAVVTAGGTETLTYAGNTVTATGLEKQMVTAVQDLTVRTPGGDDNLGITQPAAGQNRITGIPAPLTFSGVASLTLDLGAGDSPSAVNSFTLPGSWAAAALGKVVILGGAGSDTLKVTAPIPSLPAAGEGYRFDGQGGADTIDASGDTDWTLSPSGLQSGPGGSGGVIALANVDQGKLTGGAGNNRLNASAFLGSVTLDGQGGNDTLTGGGGDDLLTGGPGNDTIAGGGGSDTLAESGNTSMALTSTSFAAVALLGTDTLSSIEQAQLAGGPGNNVLDASRFPGTVYFTGGLGSDKFLGGTGANWLLETGDVNFTLTGTSLTRTNASSVVLGTDTLSRITGVQLTGGPGDNVFVVSSWISGVLGKIDGRGGTDTVVCAGDVVAASLGNTNFALTDAQLTRKVGPTAYGAFTLAGIEVASLSGGASNNLLDASGFSGTTYLTGGLGNDTFRGGSGFDWLVEAGNTNFALTNTSLSGVGADSLTSIGGAILTGGAGNNTLDARGFSGKVILNGGAGSDTLYAGAGGGVLLGGAGNDVLSAGAGRAVLIGGVGIDSLFGGAGDDLLIHGGTAYDASTAALLAVLAEWQRSDQTYSQRIDHLRNGTGLNGAARLTAATVPDDASGGDQLTGGGGDDWFWAKVPFDLLKDRKSNEQVN
jgi:Ca2+-binding RTX toxin-like protein